MVTSLLSENQKANLSAWTSRSRDTAFPSKRRRRMRPRLAHAIITDLQTSDFTLPKAEQTFMSCDDRRSTWLLNCIWCRYVNAAIVALLQPEKDERRKEYSFCFMWLCTTERDTASRVRTRQPFCTIRTQPRKARPTEPRKEISTIVIVSTCVRLRESSRTNCLSDRVWTMSCFHACKIKVTEEDAANHVKALTIVCRFRSITSCILFSIVNCRQARTHS
mmetsp:Transcript_13370/g.29962  ORF Transcript_13370/g.29962 Transcript_13370/m.29962 type:complete len:220 (-) Transcript_13370:883-1542(-)